MGVVSKFVKCNRVEALDSESKLRGLGMERFRKSRIKTLLHFMMVGGVGGGNKIILIGFGSKSEFKRMVCGVCTGN